MVNSLKELKQNRKQMMEKIDTEVTKMNQSNSGNDDARFWYPSVNKAGNGFAIIRFLPAPQGEEIPFVRLWSHNFKGPKGAWYIENCLSTLGQPDPVNEYNTELWNTGTQRAQDQVRKQKRKLTYISNILVIQDKENPENEGKVFLFKYGKKIWDKIQDVLKPKFEDETPINVFDPWEGANLKLKIVTKDEYRNYDSSSFDRVAAVGDDDFIEKIWKQEYPLKEFLDSSNFKPYEELKRKLHQVLALDSTNSVAAKINKALDVEDEIPSFDHKEAPFATDDDEDADLAKIRAMVDEE